MNEQLQRFTVTTTRLFIMLNLIFLYLCRTAEDLFVVVGYGDSTFLYSIFC